MSTPQTIAHSDLSTLSADDHSQYLYLNGRSGGQTITGGTAAGDDLTLKATSGNGVGGENIFLKIGNNGSLTAQISQLNGQAALGVNFAPIAIISGVNTSDSNEAFEVVGDGANANMAAAMFRSVANGPGFNFTKGRGSYATPTQVQAGDVLGAISGFPIDNSGPPGVERGPTTAITMRATENITSTAWGSDMTFYTVALGTTTQIAALVLQHDGTPQWPQGNTTGAGSAALGSNCPAVTVTAPYKWLSMSTADGSRVYVPAWK